MRAVEPIIIQSQFQLHYQSWQIVKSVLSTWISQDIFRHTFKKFSSCKKFANWYSCIHQLRIEQSGHLFKCFRRRGERKGLCVIVLCARHYIFRTFVVYKQLIFFWVALNFGDNSEKYCKVEPCTLLSYYFPLSTSPSLWESLRM